MTTSTRARSCPAWPQLWTIVGGMVTLMFVTGSFVLAQVANHHAESVHKPEFRQFEKRLDGELKALRADVSFIRDKVK